MQIHLHPETAANSCNFSTSRYEYWHWKCSSCLQALWNKAVQFKSRVQRQKRFLQLLFCPGICCAYLLFGNSSLFHGAFKNILSSQPSCQVPLQAGYSLLPFSQVKPCISKAFLTLMGSNVLSPGPTCEVISWPSFPLYEAMKQSHKRTER